MAVSIRAALKNVASDNYDKKNIFIYLLLVFIGGLCGGFAPDGKETFKPEFLLLRVIYFILTLIVAGISTIATNNAIKKRKGVFPNPAQNFSKIVSVAFQYMAGAFITLFLPTAFCSVLLAIAIVINPWTGLFVIPIMFFVLYYWLGLYFNYLISLEFKDWFNLKKASEFLKMAKGKFSSYILKAILLQIISGVIVFIIVLIPMIVLSVLIGIGNQENSATAQMILISIYTLASAIVFGICAIYMVDLSGQFVRSVIPKAPPKQIQQEKV